MRSGFDPWVGKIPRDGSGYPLQYSCLENLVDRGAWCATVHGVTESLSLTEQLGTHTHIWGCQVRVAACGIFFSCGMQSLSCSLWGLVPWSGSNPASLHWEPRVPVIGPPEKFLFSYILSTLRIIALSFLYIWIVTFADSSLLILFFLAFLITFLAVQWYSFTFSIRSSSF